MEEIFDLLSSLSPLSPRSKNTNSRTTQRNSDLIPFATPAVPINDSSTPPKQTSPLPSPRASSHPTSQPSPQPSPILPLIQSDHVSHFPKTTRLSVQERLKKLNEEIEKPIINIHRIRALAFDGLPEGNLRAVYWKLLLNYLPSKRCEWESSLSNSRQLYKSWNADLVIDPHKDEEPDEVLSQDVTDHPLNTSPKSQWNTFFQDNDIIHEIDKDVHRTFPHLHFFQIGNPLDSDIGAKMISNEHYRALRRILFMWVKLNKGIAYVQGMNEILGPIYYTFATDTDPTSKEHVEADSFFCFLNLMSEIRDNFCKSLDHSQLGIRHQIAKLNELFREKDPELWRNLEEKQLNPQFYSFRWLTLLLCQEFELPDVLRLWDTLLADEYRFRHLLYICISMLVNVREKLLDGDFADNLKLLQTYPPCDLLKILSLANEIASPFYQPPPRRFTGDPLKLDLW